MSDKIVFIDIETGGLKCYPHTLASGKHVKMNPIIQLAAVVFDCKTKKIGEEIEFKIQFDEAETEPEALRINHFNADTWTKKSYPVDVVQTELSSFLRRNATVGKFSKAGKPYKVACLGGHNISGFDYQFLRSWYGEKFFPADHHVIDTMSAASIYEQIAGIKFENLKLTTLCKYFGVELGLDAHDALVDIRATANLWKKLTEKFVIKEN